MIQKEWLAEIERYSFIDKAERIGQHVFIRYTKNGKQKNKRFPLRVTGSQLQKSIVLIKKEIGVKHFEKKHGKYYII